ncbi:MAG: hypothetical protein ACYC5O_06595 [Anaerolineae bacterium]
MEETQAKVPTAAPSEAVTTPATGLRGFARRHPQLTAWVALAIVMVALVLWSARDVDLLLTQRLSIVLATVGLAGLCVWIIGWD